MLTPGGEGGCWNRGRRRCDRDVCCATSCALRACGRRTTERAPPADGGGGGGRGSSTERLDAAGFRPTLDYIPRPAVPTCSAAIGAGDGPYRLFVETRHLDTRAARLPRRVDHGSLRGDVRGVAGAGPGKRFGRGASDDMGGVAVMAAAAIALARAGAACAER
jgi:acetylornithine deacetylase/succinyl-diaminopimelate desuccinylase-like protein